MSTNDDSHDDRPDDESPTPAQLAMWAAFAATVLAVTVVIVAYRAHQNSKPIDTRPAVSKPVVPPQPKPKAPAPTPAPSATPAPKATQSAPPASVVTTPRTRAAATPAPTATPRKSAAPTPAPPKPTPAPAGPIVATPLPDLSGYPIPALGPAVPILNVRPDVVMDTEAWGQTAGRVEVKPEQEFGKGILLQGTGSIEVQTGQIPWRANVELALPKDARRAGLYIPIDQTHAIDVSATVAGSLLVDAGESRIIPGYGAAPMRAHTWGEILNVEEFQSDTESWRVSLSFTAVSGMVVIEANGVPLLRYPLKHEPTSFRVYTDNGKLWIPSAQRQRRLN